MQTIHTQTAKLSLLPLILFVSLFLGTGLHFHLQGVEYAFYQVPAPILVIPAIIFAIILNRDTLNKSIETFIHGAGHSNIITMCMIYLFAGAFSVVAKATGGVDAVVNAGISVIPVSLLLPGLFIITATVATAMGTSMGTIGAIAPIAYGLAQSAQLDMPLVAGVVLSGAMFGDNLSIISDTTIAATKTQNATVRDKFKENLVFALPAAFITLLYLAYQTPNIEHIEKQSFEILAMLPYFAILALALAGVNVFVVLLLGIIFAGIAGAYSSDYTLNTFTNDVYLGFTSVQEIFLLSMLIGGLSEFIRTQGGLAYISSKIEFGLAKIASLSKGAAKQLAIGVLAFVTNLCIANNTVAIVVTGAIAKRLAEEEQIPAKRSASLLDIFSCVSQGVVPYGAQILLLGATFHLSPLTVAANSYYVLILLVISLIIIFRR
ncbi:Na+/H+ antiporter NhaC family protein [Flocculibacter collagenilyticus]|uniref:Na+/H+ antiporter NhaC family protein n=1 Tax=Flocculibacter collagenilyticus TaxID=2744479 RepID=UPI0018F6DD44|nr:Na+/H+ antiporter NhaC family protein [Flocculibacter collagenilyticus]